jgi:hypothetical protein
MAARTELQQPGASALAHWADWLALAGLAAIALLTFAAPIHNWDLVAYAAAALSVFEADPVARHAAAYDALRAALPAADYQSQISANAFQRAAAESPEVLRQQLPFYWVKPGFVALLSLAATLGFNPVSAALALTSAAYGAAGLVAYAWTARHLARPLAALAVLACFAVPQIMIPGRYGTPDGVALFAVILALYLGFGLGRFGWMAFGLLLSLTLRPDTVVLFGPAILYAALWRHMRLWAAALWLAAGAAFVLVSGALAGSYGWAVLIHHSLIALQTRPEGFVPGMPLSAYAAAYADGLRWSLQQQSLLLFSAVGLLAGLLRWRAGGWRDPILHLLVIVGLAAWANTALFPIQMDRRLVPAYLIALLALAMAAGDLRGPQQSGAADP